MTRKRKIAFANVIITVCVVISGIVTMVTLWEYHRLDTVMPSSVIASLLSIWGGELLIIALRQIFGSDVTKPKYAKTTQQNETGVKMDNSDIFGGSI